jgi:hypothetical protein
MLQGSPTIIRNDFGWLWPRSIADNSKKRAARLPVSRQAGLGVS